MASQATRQRKGGMPPKSGELAPLANMGSSIAHATITNNNNNNNNSSSSNCNNSTSQLLPTKTPPTTPTTSHHFRHAHSKRATSLFSTIAEEEIEELQYQRQTGTLDHGGMSRHLNSSYIQATAAVAAADDDDEL